MRAARGCASANARRACGCRFHRLAGAAARDGGRVLRRSARCRRRFKPDPAWGKRHGARGQAFERDGPARAPGCLRWPSWRYFARARVTAERIGLAVPVEKSGARRVLPRKMFAAPVIRPNRGGKFSHEVRLAGSDHHLGRSVLILFHERDTADAHIPIHDKGRKAFQTRPLAGSLDTQAGADLEFRAVLSANQSPFTGIQNLPGSVIKRGDAHADRH